MIEFTHVKGVTALLLTAGLLVAGAAPRATSAAAAAEPPAEWDGLVRVNSKQLDQVYVLPGATFAGYKRIRLYPVQVSFDKRWKPNEDAISASARLSPTDLEKIKSNLAGEFRKVFSAELAKSGYALVDEDGEDVLGVEAAIVNLYITAPAKQTATRSRSYVASSGHMTLVTELRDSVTSQLLARAIDTVQGRKTDSFQIATPVSNMADARAAMTKWAAVLRNGLDEAEGRPAAR